MARQTIYGWHTVLHMLSEHPARVLEVHRLADRADGRAQRLDELLELTGLSCRNATREQLERLAGAPRHQGIVAVIRPARERDESELLDLLDAMDGDPLILVLDGVQDPHNLGACLRSADGAGCHAVIVPKRRAVGLTDTVRKVAAGAAETVPLFRVTNLVRTLKALKDRGVHTVATSDQAADGLYDITLTGPLALVMGGEAKGVRRLTAETCDRLAGLPMAGSVTSLNVSVTTGVALYEAVRQRIAPNATSR